MATTKVRLLVPTVGKKRGEVIEVEKAEADRLVANGSARAHKDEPKKG